MRELFRLPPIAALVCCVWLMGTSAQETSTTPAIRNKPTLKIKTSPGAVAPGISTVSRENSPPPRPPALTTDMVTAQDIANTRVEVSAWQAGFPVRLLEAMDARIGIPYQYNGSEDTGYDCSGFVWRVFREAGMRFQRSSARNYWENFPEATEEEQQMFGTLVFFNDLGHAGIVRDAKSFYHSATSQGVMLSPLDGYWASRIVGYRRIPNLPPLLGDLPPGTLTPRVKKAPIVPAPVEAADEEADNPETKADTKADTKAEAEPEEETPRPARPRKPAKQLR
ncbi:MAG: C40 family peptidase [Blastocatellia bacterium]